MKTYLPICICTIMSLAGYGQLKNIVTDKLPGVNCDNVVHDKLEGALNRTPSECEVLFDQRIRNIFDEAFKKVFFRKENSDWIMNVKPEMTPIEGVGRNTETDIFRLSNTDNGDFNYELQINSNSPAGQAWSKKFYETMEALKADAAANMPRFMELSYDMKTATNILLYTSINNASSSFGSFKGGHQSVKIPGAAYTFRAVHVAALSGGGDENSRDACLIVFGKWQPPVIAKYEDGSDSIRLEAILNKSASKFSVQNIVVRIECNKQLTDQLLREIDFNKLQSMLSQ